MRAGENRLGKSTTVDTIRLAVVDDSLFVRKALERLFDQHPRIEVVGTAASGEEILERLDAWRPDVVTLDLSMPGMGGLETLDRILAWRRIPVIILSTYSNKDAPLTLEALDRGAVDFVDKSNFSLVDFDALRSALFEKLIEVTAGREEHVEPEPPAARPAITRPTGALSFSILMIGASTGGPPAIQQLLEELGAAPSVPIVVVQHMPLGFTKAFADRLNAHLPLMVREAVHGEPLERGKVYIAPSGLHLRVRSKGEELTAVLTRQPEEAQHRPSVDVLFESGVPIARRVLAVLLTGMGHDGGQGLLALYSAGAMTIAQNESSSIVYGMPRTAVELGAVCEQLHLSRIGERISELLRPARATAT
jgi:two-component system, chemotaxis family, protein-glutamate methylesterase/glutaminase